MISTAFCRLRCLIGRILRIGLLLLWFSIVQGQQLAESSTLDVILPTAPSPDLVKLCDTSPTANDPPEIIDSQKRPPEATTPRAWAASTAPMDQDRLKENGLFAALVLVSYGIGRYLLARRKRQILRGESAGHEIKQSRMGRYFRLVFAEGIKDTIDELKSAHTREQIEEIITPVEQVIMKLGRGKAHAPLIFALKILRLHAIGETTYAIQELTRYGKSESDVKEAAAGMAAFNLLIREEPQGVLPALYHLIVSECDCKTLQRAQHAEIIEVPGLREATPQQKRDVRRLCRLYADLLARETPRLLAQEARIEKILKRYEAMGLLALHNCITHSQERIKEWAFVPIDVPAQLCAASFDDIPSLRDLKDILVQFEGVQLYPLQTEERSGFLDVLQTAQQQLNEIEEAAKCLPECRMAIHLIESWRHFAEHALSEGAKAELIANPFTTNWLPTNVALEDVCIAWVFHNQGPSFAKLHQVIFSWEGQELARDAEEVILRPDEQKIVSFNLDQLEGAHIPSRLDLTIAIHLSDGQGPRVERIHHAYYGFEAMTSFRGYDVFGKEIVDLLQSNKPLPPDAVRQYCAKAQLHVHCNQFALSQLLDHGGRNPLLVHILLYGLINYLTDEEMWQTNQPRYISCTDVPRVVDYLVHRDLKAPPGLLAKAWKTFPLDERAALEVIINSSEHHVTNPASLDEIPALVSTESPPTSILERLEAKGLIEKSDEEHYRLQAKLLEKWLRARQA